MTVKKVPTPGLRPDSSIRGKVSSSLDSRKYSHPWTADRSKHRVDCRATCSKPTRALGTFYQPWASGMYPGSIPDSRLAMGQICTRTFLGFGKEGGLRPRHGGMSG